MPIADRVSGWELLCQRGVVMSEFLSRRALLGGFAALPVVGIGTAEAREVVPVPLSYPRGAVVVSTSQRKLYFILGDGQALRYTVAVGRPGKQWFGQRVIDGKHVRPAWSPPAEVRRDNPRLPNVIPGGAPNNPMGERVMTISPGEYAIHGTNVPTSIGTFASYGCVRMHNHDVVDLFERVSVGAPIIVLK